MCRVGTGGFFVLVRLVVSGREMFLGMGLCDTIPSEGLCSIQSGMVGYRYIYIALDHSGPSDYSLYLLLHRVSTS